MSIDQGDIDDGARRSASQLLARAAAAMTRADDRLAAATGDFFVADDARLDDRTRAVLAMTLTAMVAAVERDLRSQAARSLAASGDGDRARWLADGEPVYGRLVASGVLRDPELMRTLIARTRQDVLADTLQIEASDEPGAPSLIARMAASADRRVATAALALMAAAGRRRDFLDTGRLARTELPAELHHRLVWWTAAAIREQISRGDADQALADAALRALAEHDESDCVEAAAVRLAVVIDAQPGELPALLTHVLGERHVALFVALLGQALRMDFATARELVVEAGDPLWLALRAAELDRATIARIGLALSKDAESFADRLDTIMAIGPADARTALAALSLPHDFRAAIAAIGRAP